MAIPEAVYSYLGFSCIDFSGFTRVFHVNIRCFINVVLTIVSYYGNINNVQSIQRR